MLKKTRGIVINQTRYGENSVIVTIYTEAWGTQAFIYQKNKKRENKSALLQGLSLVELVAYYKEQRGVQRISELRAIPVLQSMHSDLQKSTITLFLTELLHKSLKEESGNPELFNFLHHSILMLENLKGQVNQFHLYFMIQLSKHFGFYPSGICNNSTPNFDLLDGVYTSSIKPSESIIPHYLANYLYQLSEAKFDNLTEIETNTALRWGMLDALVKFFELHHTHGKNIQSHFVLKEVLHA